MKKVCFTIIFFVIAAFTACAIFYIEFQKQTNQYERVCCRKMLFEYPLLITDREYIFSRDPSQYRLYGKEGIIVIPKYHQGSPYGKIRKQNHEVTLGKPFILQLDSARSLGTQISEVQPSALNADSFLIFVKGCAPVHISSYFPEPVIEDSSTHTSIQFLGVHKLQPQQTIQLNRIIVQELLTPPPLHVRYSSIATSFEKALDTKCFLGYNCVCWPKECIDEIFNSQNRGTPSSGDYTVSTMISWSTVGPNAIVQWSYTEEDILLISKFLGVN